MLSIIATQTIIAGFFAARVASRAGFNLSTIRKSVLDIRGPWMSYAIMGLVPMIVSPLILMCVRSMIYLPSFVDPCIYLMLSPLSVTIS